MPSTLRLTVTAPALRLGRVALLGAAIMAARSSHAGAAAASESMQTRPALSATCAGCPPMVRVPPLPGPKPQPLFVARHETTWREYLLAVREAGCPSPRLNDESRADPNDPRLQDDYPVTGVTIYEYQCYLDWLSRQAGVRYRLPTAAEWEHFARAGTKTRYPWGDELGQNHAAVDGHYDQNRFRRSPPEPLRSPVWSGVLVPVESFAPNPWGLFDTIGNANEATTEIKYGPETCLKLQKADWCRLVAGRGGAGFKPTADDLMTERYLMFAGGINSVRGYRPVHNH